MNFVDHTLVRLASPSLRQPLFDEVALQQILSACYDTDALPISAPFVAHFSEFECAMMAPSIANGYGKGYLPGTPDPINFNLELSGLPEHQVTQAHAYWRGSIRANSAPESSTISNVDLNWASISQLDSSIIAADGALPVGSIELENRRRLALQDTLRAAVSDPTAVTDSTLGHLLNSMDVNSIDELLQKLSGSSAGLTLKFSAANNALPSPQLYPISSGILIYDTGFSITQALFESKRLLKSLDQFGLDSKLKKSLTAKRSAVVVWLVPAAVFDDTDWPGATPGMNAEQARSARRMHAGQWLANEGIGLSVIN